MAHVVCGKLHWRRKFLNKTVAEGSIVTHLQYSKLFHVALLVLFLV